MVTRGARVSSDNWTNSWRLHRIRGSASLPPVISVECTAMSVPVELLHYRNSMPFCMYRKIIIVTTKFEVTKATNDLASKNLSYVLGHEGASSLLFHWICLHCDWFGYVKCSVWRRRFSIGYLYMLFVGDGPKFRHHFHYSVTCRTVKEMQEKVREINGTTGYVTNYETSRLIFKGVTLVWWKYLGIYLVGMPVT
jgi:hypothetical protein